MKFFEEIEGAIVIKLGGRVQRDPALGRILAKWWELHRGEMCVVHGGGDEVTALQRSMGIEPKFINGRRVTSPEDIDLLRMVLSGSANKRLVHTARQAGIPAAGISGEDGPLFTATVLDGGALGAVGRVTAVDTTIISALWEAPCLPIISPLSAPGLNVNGDEAAAVLTEALDADVLLLISDVSGVQVHGTAVAYLDVAQAKDGLASGEINGGMVVKVEAALKAIEAGIKEVRIGGMGLLDGSQPGTALVRQHHPRVPHLSVVQ